MQFLTWLYRPEKRAYLANNTDWKNKKMEYQIKRKERICDEFFHIEKVFLDHDKFDGGEHQNVRRYVSIRPDAVAVILENVQNKSIVLVRQFRLPPVFREQSGWQTEVIAGLVDKDESLEDCVKREIHEETGYEAKNLEKVTSFLPSIGISAEVIHLFYAQTDGHLPVGKGGGLEHEHEDIQVIEKPIAVLMEEIANQTIIDGKTILAIQWLLLKKQGLLPARPTNG